MENDLILRYAAIDALLKQPNTPTPSVIRRVLRQVPTVDAVPVVRCSECVSHGYDEEHDRHWCNSPMGCMGCVPVKPDDFCSRGKRRSDP